MKIKTTELQGPALDWAVAKCRDWVAGTTVDDLVSFVLESSSDEMHFWPSTDWAQAGPIIDLERIAIWFERYDDIDAGLPCWFAAKYGEREYPGSTPLIAAMRAYVAYKLGDEVEVPEELSA